MNPEPERAARCDFSKLCMQTTSKDTSIATWYLLAPEVTVSAGDQYGQNLDVWMLALALVHAGKGRVPNTFRSQATK